MIQIIDLDELAGKCGYFNSECAVNNGYGCNHPDCEDSDIVSFDEYGNQISHYNYELTICRKILQRICPNLKDLREIIENDKIFKRYFQKLSDEPYHPMFLKTLGLRQQGKCYSFSCPIANEANLEDLKKYDIDYYNEWKDEKYDPSEAEVDLMVYDF